MGRFLAYHPRLQGLSKKKIAAVLIVFALLAVLALIFSSYTDSYASSKVVNAVNRKSYNNSATGTVTAILQEVQRNQQKLLVQTAASAAYKLSGSATIASNVQAVATISEVPSIVDDDSRQLKQQELALKLRHELAKVNNRYDSYTAKSLLYSNVSKFSTSSPVLKNAHTSRYITASSAVSASAMDSYAQTSDGGTKGSALLATTMVRAAPGDYLDSELTVSRSPYEVKAGSVIPATMINGLNSDMPGQIIAQVRQNVYSSTTRQYLLIPQGAKLIGMYDSHIAYGQERILVAWQRLIYPDGSSINLRAMPGSDLEGYAGFYDQVDNHYWKIFGTSFIMGVITAAMQYSQNSTNANVQSGGIALTTNPNPTLGQTLSGSLGQQLGQTGLSITQRNLNIQPTLIIRPNYPFNIMVTADMILKPWRW